MKVVFRADASLEIGTGHVMRCLTLADTLKRLGSTCSFICRNHPGNLVGLIEQRGYGVVVLDDGSNCGPKDVGPDDVAWLGVAWYHDAEETKRVLEGAHLDWLLVDHYGIDHRWELALRPTCNRLMVIDDLADRLHDCDLLLDQNLGRSEQDYQGLLSPAAPLLIGPRYALLRAEFSKWRERSLLRRINPDCKRVLIALGGVDKDNVTGQVLVALKARSLPSNLHITVVMGAQAPWLTEVQQLLVEMPCPTALAIDVNNMAELMASSDVAVGASGGSVWERCALGLPSLLIIMAENQRSGSFALAERRAAIVCSSVIEVSEWLMFFLKDKSSLSLLKEISKSCAELVDGDGASRVALAMSVPRV